LIVLFLLTIVLSVLQFTISNYPFGIFKLFLGKFMASMIDVDSDFGAEKQYGLGAKKGTCLLF